MQKCTCFQRGLFDQLVADPFNLEDKRVYLPPSARPSQRTTFKALRFILLGLWLQKTRWTVKWMVSASYKLPLFQPLRNRHFEINRRWLKAATWTLLRSAGSVVAQTKKCLGLGLFLWQENWWCGLQLPTVPQYLYYGPGRCQNQLPVICESEHSNPCCMISDRKVSALRLRLVWKTFMLLEKMPEVEFSLQCLVDYR